MPARRSTEKSPSYGYGVVVVGASWGGLEALTSLVRGLPGDFAVPVVVIQHRGRDSKTLLADLLQDRSRLRVSEPDDKEPLLPGHVYVAPSDYHLLVDDGYLTLEMDAPVRYSRPSIDVTFTSAADTFGARAIGVVLTGANADGAIGLRSIVDAGGTGIVQDPDSAEMPVMPRAARLAVPEAIVLPVEKIAPHLVSLVAAAEAGVRTT
jgi:two-component system, chemotaxis family, protein-glutamate methylesterase/glutaminase